MARNYKRDSKGRFAKFNSNRKARKEAIRKQRSTIYEVRRGPKKGTVRMTNLNQIKSIQNHTIGGALIGTAVLPVIGTGAGAIAGAAIGARRKKNRPIIMAAASTGGRRRR